MEALVRINKDIPLTIFDEPVLQDKATHLFDGAEEKFKERFNEIVTFLGVALTNELSYENIAFLFKVYFYKSILSEAIEMTFFGQGKYDVLSNIISLLSEEKMENAIMGAPMIDAFIKAIRSIPTTGDVSACCLGSKIVVLESLKQRKNIGPIVNNFPK